jgi:hypothetical protein
MHLVERVFQLELPFKKTARLFSIVWATEEKAALIFLTFRTQAFNPCPPGFILTCSSTPNEQF